MTRALLCAALLAASGCAATGTVAFGREAVATISLPAACPPAGQKVTETATFDDKIGFKPQVESVETVTEPAPAAAATHESKGADLSAGAGGVIGGLARLFVCGVTFGRVCP